jgi:hypothetical protein
MAAKKYQALMSTAVALTLLATTPQAAAPVTGDLPRAEATPAVSAERRTNAYIVQAGSTVSAQELVANAGGQITATLGVINAVAAELTSHQYQVISRAANARVYEDAAAKVSGQGRGKKEGRGKKGKSPKQRSAQAAEQAPALDSAVAATRPVVPITVDVVEPVADSVSPYGTAATVSNTTATPLGGAATSPADPLSQFLAGMERFFSTADTGYPQQVGAAALHDLGLIGQDVGVAVIDTGFWDERQLEMMHRLAIQVDTTQSPIYEKRWDEWRLGVGDDNGHGTHVSSVIGSHFTSDGRYEGVAPGVDIISLRAFAEDGSGSYQDVIEAVDWVVAHKDEYNIRVLNLSFSATPRSHYWDDPLNQAVMAAWQAGIVVVASAGNTGPDPMTVGVPGNVPYVITVGAATDNFTPEANGDDRLASFSAAGPTHEGFVKPDLVAPGGHIMGWMPYKGYIASRHPESVAINQKHFAMSGTSQAAAVASGAVALMLQAEPSLSPDEVKCKLMASARPAVDGKGQLAYSVFQQGAGFINVAGAVASSATGCANVGLDIDDDLAGIRHFGGPANRDADGNYYVMDMQASEPNQSIHSDGYTWSQGYTWARATPGLRATHGARATHGPRDTFGARATSGASPCPGRMRLRWARRRPPP